MARMATACIAPWTSCCAPIVTISSACYDEAIVARAEEARQQAPTADFAGGVEHSRGRLRHIVRGDACAVEVVKCAAPSRMRKCSLRCRIPDSIHSDRKRDV